jgi:predicted HTH transcriptional regulator
MPNENGRPLVTLRSVPVETVTRDHLRSLVDDGVAELRSIEYKQELPGNSDQDKRKFLSDVSSFANANGGDLVYGISEAIGIP